MYKENNTLISSAWWQCSDRNDLLPYCYKTQVRDSATRPTVPYRDTSPDMFQGRELSTWRTFRCSRPGAYKRHSEAVKIGSIKETNSLLPSFFDWRAYNGPRNWSNEGLSLARNPRTHLFNGNWWNVYFFCILYNYKSNKNIITKKTHPNVTYLKSK